MDPSTTHCPDGHAMEAPDAFCGVCGAPPASGPPTERSGRFGHPLVGVALAGIAAAAVVIAIILLAGEPDETPVESADPAETTTSMPIENLCQVQMLAWLDYTTQPGNSIMAVAAEFGTESPEWAIVTQAWEEYRGNLFQVGRSDATQLAIDLIETGCTNLGDRFVPGSLPPQ